ncbi:hypothetical protein [Roseococcus pinisoli]|uniref:Uncharacterized protein n=1 Tax=Roseococcus pinisoli TaxID=2835040 RepID=A0ABS5QIS0_9PROT|nr:hypothetical protein [Roseococcus pinisoli]MBS7813251.1 hypothetical protein [Roseococcus pinisoli]
MRRADTAVAGVLALALAASAIALAEAGSKGLPEDVICRVGVERGAPAR